MAAAISLRIPAGKLGTVRVDRTVDVYPAPVNNTENDFNTKSSSSSIPTMALHRQLTKTAVTATPTPLIIDDNEQLQQIHDNAHNYVPITKWVDNTNNNNNNNNSNNNNNNNDVHDDDQMSDIAVIYSVVRHSSTSRVSSPKIIVSPIATNVNNTSRPTITKSYTLEAPLTPVVTHTSKQAQIKTLSSTRSTTNASIPTSVSAPASTQSYLSSSLIPPISPSTRIQASTSFTSHDRPTVPSVAIKPRPYSFRSAINPSNEVSLTKTNTTSTISTTTSNNNNNNNNNTSSQSIRSRRSFRTAPRNVIERQISNITGRVSQLHDSLLARLSDFTSSTTNRQRNRSLTSLHSTTVNTANLTENDLRLTQNLANTRQQRRTVKPRPKSETYDDHHRVNAAGSYAQLTLLGQPKTNSTSIQKVLPNENQNGRVPLRGVVGGQSNSMAERSNSTISTSSLHNTFDTKKAKDIYERITKQLEKARSDLERQRAKGSNQNSSKISTLENQIRQYEQQLNDIRRRTDLVESSSDISPVKSSFSTENLGNQSNIYNEQIPNRTSIYADTSIDDKHGLRDPFETDDETAELPSKTSITSFDDIQQSINTSNWAVLTIFLNYLLTDSNNDPAYLLFYMFTEELRLKKAENRSELVRWIFEIHSTFTMNGSPLYIGLPQTQTDAINRYLEAQSTETNDEIKYIFNDAKDFARTMIIERQLPDLNQKRTQGLYRDIDFPSNTKPNHFIEETLRSKFESYYKSSNDDWNSTKNSKELALICSLATYLKRCDIKKCGNIPLEKIPKFFEREQRRLLSKLPRATQAKRIKEHHLNEHQFTTQTFCKVCSKILWGINYQGYLCGYCQQAFHRECVSNSDKCTKDRKLTATLNSNQSKPRKIHKNPSSPSRSTSLNEGREGSVPRDGGVDSSLLISEANDSPNSNLLLYQEHSKNSSLGRCPSDRQPTPHRPTPKHRSSSGSDESDEGNPQMGGSTIDELLSRIESEQFIQHQDSFNHKNSFDFANSDATGTTDGDSDLEADVNTLPNLNDFIPTDVLQALYQSREWKLQTTINELIHTERTHLKGLKIMKKCFREPMQDFAGMNANELECIFRNLDQLIELHSQFKYALRQHRDEVKDHVVRHIGDLILKFLDGEKGEQFASACAYFIEDQSQALKLIKKKEQSPDFAALMRQCEANPLCRRLTLKDYLPSIMTRFTKLKMLFEAMKKFVADDEIESNKLSKCVDCADNILKRMNHARLRKEQEALLKQIKANLDIQMPNDDKSININNLLECLDVTNNRLIYSGTLKLLPDISSQKNEFECCLFTDIFVFFQKIPLQPSEQRGIEETHKYVLKEHQRDATSGRRPRTATPATRFQGGQNFILTPVIRLEHLLIKKKACGGARSFYVIDTDKKQLIEVEANSKDDLEKWLEWIEKACKPFEKSKSFASSSQKSLNSSISSHSNTSTLTPRSAIIEEQANIQLVEPTQVKITEKQTLIEDTPDSLLNAILEKDNELNRLLHEKELLLSRLLNIPRDQTKDMPGHTASLQTTKVNSPIEALTNAASYHNQILQAISQTQNRTAKEKKITPIDFQTLWSPLAQLGEQLSLALKLSNQQTPSSTHVRRTSSNSSALTITPSITSGTSQISSDLKDSLSMSSLHSSESLTSVALPTQSNIYSEISNYQVQPSSITDLDETMKSQKLHMAQEIVERYDEGVFDDGTISQNEDDETNSVVLADSDDEDEIEHFDSTDSFMNVVEDATNILQTNLDNSNNISTEGQTINVDEEYDNVKSNNSSISNEYDKNLNNTSN